MTIEKGHEISRRKHAKNVAKLGHIIMIVIIIIIIAHHTTNKPNQTEPHK